MLTTLAIVLIACLVLAPLRMASALAVEKYRAELFCRLYDNDPGAATAKLASPDGGTTPWVWDMRDFPEGALIGVKPSVIAGLGITLVRVLACTGSDGTGTVTEVKTTGAIQLDHMTSNGGDQAWLELLPSELAAISDSHRYFVVEITHADATDESVVAVVAKPRFPRTGLTATQQA